MPATDSFTLGGHVALVTGGNRGIGLGMARGLARAGADIAIWARDPERNTIARKELETFGSRVHTYECDVTDPEAVDAAMADTIRVLGRVDSCFANAGTSALTAFLDQDLAGFRSVLQTNLEGAFLTLQAAARQMVEQGDGGSLVGISSLASRGGVQGGQAYAASKAGLNAMIRGCAVELARHGIRANSILPGWIESEMTEAHLASEGMQKRALPRVPQRRWGTPQDLSGIAVYLASDASRYHTGDEIVIDGGYAIF